MTAHQWMAEVLSDLEIYAQSNGLSKLLPHLRACQRELRGEDSQDATARDSQIVDFKAQKSQ